MSIMNFRRAFIAGVAGLIFAGGAGPAPAQHYDVIIRGGTLVDGTGSPRRPGDLAIKGDRIVEVGTLTDSATATTVIDAKGKLVTPGFIDPHSHAAPNIATPELAAALPMLYQGVTTVMINPDGGGPGDLTALLADIGKVTPGVNVVPMIGHGGVRSAVMGLENRKATPAELARMERLVEKAMAMGAFGLSDGPFYVPAKYSDTAEIVALAKASARYPDSFYTSHIRDESDYNIGIMAAIDEVIAVAREARIPSVVTHVKLLGPSVWGKAGDVIRKIEDARAEGLPVWADQYPYTAGKGDLAAALLPGWAQEGGPAGVARRLDDPEQRARIRKEMAPNLARRAGAHALLIASYAPDRSLEGKRLDEIARERSQDPLDAAIDILRKDDAGFITFVMQEPDVEALMKQPWTMTSSDGELPVFDGGPEHPRSYGAFARKLRNYAIDARVISVEQAIHAATGLTAQVFTIRDRGVLRPGAYADVLIIDPQTVRERATYSKPHAYSEGMDYVFVNGRAAVVDGKAVPQRHGRLLLRERRPIGRH